MTKSPSLTVSSLDFVIIHLLLCVFFAEGAYLTLSIILLIVSSSTVFFLKTRTLLLVFIKVSSCSGVASVSL